MRRTGCGFHETASLSATSSSARLLAALNGVAKQQSCLACGSLGSLRSLVQPERPVEQLGDCVRIVRVPPTPGAAHSIGRTTVVDRTHALVPLPVSANSGVGSEVTIFRSVSV